MLFQVNQVYCLLNSEYETLKIYIDIFSGRTNFISLLRYTFGMRVEYVVLNHFHSVKILIKDNPGQVWFNLVKWILMTSFRCDLNFLIYLNLCYLFLTTKYSLFNNACCYLSSKSKLLWSYPVTPSLIIQMNNQRIYNQTCVINTIWIEGCYQDDMHNSI
jgi:hypothetical protein